MCRITRVSIQGSITPWLAHVHRSWLAGAFELEARFNLSAYVRHEIAEAIEAYRKAMREGE